MENSDAQSHRRLFYSLDGVVGGEISICGTISVVRQLLFAGLVDTLTLMVHPVVAGSGRHLFQPNDPATRLTLDEARRTAKGNAILSYGLRYD